MEKSRHAIKERFQHNLESLQSDRDRLVEVLSQFYETELIDRPDSLTHDLKTGEKLLALMCAAMSSASHSKRYFATNEGSVEFDSTGLENLIELIGQVPGKLENSFRSGAGALSESILEKHSHDQLGRGLEEFHKRFEKRDIRRRLRKLFRFVQMQEDYEGQHQEEQSSQTEQQFVEYLVQALGIDHSEGARIAEVLARFAKIIPIQIAVSWSTNAAVPILAESSSTMGRLFNEYPLEIVLVQLAMALGMLGLRIGTDAELYKQDGINIDPIHSLLIKRYVEKKEGKPNHRKTAILGTVFDVVARYGLVGGLSSYLPMYHAARIRENAGWLLGSTSADLMSILVGLLYSRHLLKKGEKVAQAEDHVAKEQSTGQQ